MMPPKQTRRSLIGLLLGWVFGLPLVKNVVTNPNPEPALVPSAPVSYSYDVPGEPICKTVAVYDSAGNFLTRSPCRENPANPPSSDS